MAESFLMCRKHCGKRRNCSSHSVFNRLILQTRKNQGLFAKGLSQFSEHKISVGYAVMYIHLPLFLNPLPNKPCFKRKSLLKTLREKEKLLFTSNFSFSHSVFYPFQKSFLPFSSNLKLPVCKLFQFGRVYNLSFRKGLKSQ